MASLSGFFKAAAPMLSTALSFIPGGGPVVAIASGILSKVTGQEVKPEQIESTMASLATSEDGRLKLQESEQEFQKAMAQMGYDNEDKLAAITEQDRDSARKREAVVKDRMPAVLSILAAASVLACVAILTFVNIPSGSKEALMILLGILGAESKDVYGYYFGSSAGSEAKTAIISRQSKS